jgi:hypothetical protein
MAGITAEYNLSQPFAPADRAPKRWLMQNSRNQNLQNLRMAGIKAEYNPLLTLRPCGQGSKGDG